MQALPYYTVDNGPGKDEVSKEVPLDVTNFFNSRTHVEHLVAITSEISVAAKSIFGFYQMILTFASMSIWFCVQKED